MPSLLDTIERVPVATLKHYPGNARRGDPKAIAESLQENGQFAPLVVQRSTRYVLAGNHTLKGAKILKWPEIDVVFVDVDDQRAKKINLAANRTAELGGYDMDALALQIEELEGDLTGTGYSDDDVAAMFGDLEPDDPFEGDGGGREDAPTGDKPEIYGVIVECDTEQQQAALLGQLDAEGFRVRALIS